MEVLDGARFCRGCGKPLAESPPAPPTRSEAPTHAGRKCPYCQVPLHEHDPVTECSFCRSVHHADCWAENRGCAIASCEGGPDGSPEATLPTSIMPAAGAPAAYGGSAKLQVDLGHPGAQGPPQDPGGSRGGRVATVLAIGAVVAILAGGATAAAVIVSGKHHHKAVAQTPPTTSQPRPTPTGGGADTTPTDGPSISPTTPTDTTATTDTTPSSDGSGPAAVMKQHYSLLDNGDYQGAFDLMTPAYHAKYPNWVTDREQGDPALRNVTVSPAETSGDSADVRVDFYTKDRNPAPKSDTTCRHFTGTVHLVRLDGRWLYDPGTSNLTGDPVPGDPECPY